MKRLLAPLASGLAVAGLLYGLLSAAERRLPEPADPWLDAFIAEGMKAEFRSLSSDPESHLMAADLRPSAEGPAFKGTQLRTYQVQNTTVQVVRFPAAGLLPVLTEGRRLEVRFKPQGYPVHVCRWGRSVMFVGVFSKSVLTLMGLKVPRAEVEQMFDAFEETAKRFP